MNAEKVETIPTVDHKPHAKFFRESAWLMIATMAGGVMTLGVHFLAKKIPESEYSAFGTLLMVVGCIPSMPLQMVFAQQSAQALAVGRERQLAGMIQLTWFWSFIVWVVGATAVFIFHDAIVARWQLPNAFGIWVTLGLLLISLWSPLFSGVLQGRQDFFWMGWASIIGGAGRFLIAAILVLAFGCGAAGMMTGALIGIGFVAFIATWRTRDLWSLRREKFDGIGLLRQVLPLAFGFGACQFLFTSDTMFAKAFFTGDQMAPYVAAGTLSRGLLWVVLPLASVMFPKIVHANAKSEKNNLFLIVLLGTAIITATGAFFLWLLGPILVRIVYNSNYVAPTTALIPWYAMAMVPLALANVMVNDLLARAKYGVVPFMVLLAVAYGFTLPFMLSHFPGRLTVVLQTLAVFNFLLFLVCAWFAWTKKSKA
jgi:O-antigen/teichoic acid export membrane protein